MRLASAGPIRGRRSSSAAGARSRSTSGGGRRASRSLAELSDSRRRRRPPACRRRRAAAATRRAESTAAICCRSSCRAAWSSSGASRQARATRTAPPRRSRPARKASALRSEGVAMAGPKTAHDTHGRRACPTVSSRAVAANHDAPPAVADIQRAGSPASNRGATRLPAAQRLIRARATSPTTCRLRTETLSMRSSGVWWAGYR